MTNPHRCMLLLVGLFVSLITGSSQAGVEGYYQQPTIVADHVVFVSEGDLWRVSMSGGLASRLTTHQEPASQPALSPDGQWLAFVAGYDGGPGVYLMPAEGGQPRRLSFEPGSVRVTGWTPDGRVVYATDSLSGPSSAWVLRTVDPDTLDRSELPLMDARQAAFDDAGGVYFVRFGLAVTGDNAREYRGGAMAQLWRFDLASDAEAVRLAPEHPGNIEFPMWHDGHVYAISDADGGNANLWRFDSDGANPTQLTFHADLEVRSADLTDGRIVYQHGADLRVLDLSSGEDALMAVRLASDRSALARRWLDRPLNYLETARLAPQGDRLVLTARGQVAIAGTGRLRRNEIELPADSRARQALMSPDGEWIYAIVDATGEHEVWKLSVSDQGAARPMTDDGNTQRLRLTLSPDGRWLAHEDMDGNLWLLDTEDGDNRLIDRSDVFGYSDVLWSGDSRYLAVVRADTGIQRRQIVLIDRSDGRKVTLTSDRYESFSPTFSLDGHWLYFLSNRHFEPTPSSPWGDRNFGPMFDRRARLYAYALSPDVDFPLAPGTELSADEAPDERTEAIDLDGVGQRLFMVDVEPGNYSSLAAAKNRLYLLDRPAGRGARAALKTIEFNPDRVRLETFAENVERFEISADGEKLFYRQAGNGDLLIVDAGARPPREIGPHRVRVGDWRLGVEPSSEWRQMFDDAWRMQRDHLFDPAMRGQDWPAIAERYRPLLDRVGDRRELDDLLGQMAAELGVLHSQVRGGDYRRATETGAPAFLGAEYERTGNGFRVTRILAGDPELPDQRAPLSRPGVDLRAGDELVAINGRALAEVIDPGLLLIHQAGQQVRVDYRRGDRELVAVVEPVSANEKMRLRYRDWVQGRRNQVEEAAQGRIGYLHLFAMGPNDIADFAREFYANIEREGLIIDVRRNRGGNIDSWLIGKLLRQAWMFWQRPDQPPFWNMQQSFRGHVVVLVDPLTYSDGETFAAGVRTLGLAPLIGQRTAGAGVWLSDQNRLVDGGLLRAAESPQFGRQGQWLIEGAGVRPDIEVENTPLASWRGKDAQLERAIDELERMLQERPVIQPEAQAIPPRGVDGDDLSDGNPPAGE